MHLIAFCRFLFIYFFYYQSSISTCEELVKNGLHIVTSETELKLSVMLVCKMSFEKQHVKNGATSGLNFFCETLCKISRNVL